LAEATTEAEVSAEADKEAKTEVFSVVKILRSFLTFFEKLKDAGLSIVAQF
jgi:hypothetical protein